MQSAENKLPGLNSVLKFSAFAACGISRDIETGKKKKMVENIRKYYFHMTSILLMTSELGGYTSRSGNLPQRLGLDG